MLEKGLFFPEYQEVLRDRELSTTKFALPIESIDIVGIWKPKYSPEHKGEFEGAVDIAVVDPRVKATYVYAPAEGVVVCGVLTNSRWGSDETDKKYLNWVHIRTTNGDFYELAHIEAIPERILRVGDVVRKGEKIARVGLNGRLTDTNGVVDSHLHFFVGKYELGGFKGLRINWE